MLELTPSGLFCAAGDFFVDPWRPVERAVVTHAHADHARPGSASYLGAASGAGVLRLRLGDRPAIETAGWGERITVGGVAVSFHPAGHILGSAQVRLEHRGEVWVVSGDYKTEPDPTCEPFEPVTCDVFITESTFGLPIYRWAPQREIFAEIDDWWRGNRDRGAASLLLGYSLGKAQRLLAGVDPSIGPIYTHGAVERLNAVYREAGIALPETTYVGSVDKGHDWAGALIVAPPSSLGTPWTRRFGDVSAGFASGWMRIRGARRRRAVDRGFTLSDHCDWPSLIDVIEATGAQRVLVTHGYRRAVVRWLEEKGIAAEPLETRFEGELDEAAVDAEAGAPTVSDARDGEPEPEREPES